MEKILSFLLLLNFIYAEFAVKSLQEVRNGHAIRQNYEQSCGAAALATLINLLDSKSLNELDILKLLYDNPKTLNTDMLSFFELEQALKKMGYESKAFRINKPHLENFNFPILAKIEDDPRFPHFVVIINHTGDFITIMDPSYGTYISSKREFYRLWDMHDSGGYVLVVMPTDHSTQYNITMPNNIAFEKLR